MPGWGLSAGGRHWSSREEDIPIEKHKSIQDVAVGNDMVAWYVQEFLPNGNDYKLSKKAEIYLGNLQNGESRLLYKGECYGDLLFDGEELYFNMGNKVAVIHLQSEEISVLFKHSGIKKNALDLVVTSKRIFFRHWTKDNNYLMWYDRETKETINPHIDAYAYFLLDEQTVVYQSLNYTWCIDLDTLKKKRLFKKKQIEEIRKQVCNFFEIPMQYYECEFNLDLKDLKAGRFSFICEGRFEVPDLDYDECKKLVKKLKLPSYISAGITCDLDGANVRFQAEKSDIVRKESDNYKGIWHWTVE